MNSRTGNLVGAILLLAFFAWLGVRSSLAASGAELTGGQRAVFLLQWWYTVLAALAIIGLLLRQAGTRLVLFAWAAIFTTRNALTPVFLGGKGIGLAIAGGAIGLAISVGVLYLAFRALEAPGETPRMTSSTDATPIPVRVRAADGTARDDGWVRTEHRPFAARVGEGLLIAGGGTAIGVLLLPVPLVHIFGVIFALTTWWFALQRVRTQTVVVSVGGTCPHCGTKGTFFAGFGRKRYRLPISTSCPSCSHALSLEPLPR